MSCDPDENYDPGIRAKREDPEPIRGRGFVRIDTPYSTLEIDSDSKISAGELEILGHGQAPIQIAFEFDNTDSDYEHSRGSIGFELSPVQAERLAAYLQAWATYKQTGEWDDPEVSDDV